MSRTFPVQVAARHGNVPAGVLADAETHVRRVAEHAPAPVLSARVTVAHDENPSLERPVAVAATLDVNGHLVRGHVLAEHFEEALDLLDAKLRHSLQILAEHRLGRRTETGVPLPGAWRHGDLPTARHHAYPRPAEEREVVRRTSYALPAESIEEAALDLELLDHEWHLFTEPETHEDAVLSREGDHYRLQVAGGTMPAIEDLALAVQPGGTVPTLGLADARTLLALDDDPFVFFVDADTGRGAVLYRRLDGHDGLVVPAGA